MRTMSLMILGREIIPHQKIIEKNQNVSPEGKMYKEKHLKYLNN